MNNSQFCITYNLDSIGFVLLQCNMVPFLPRLEYMQVLAVKRCVISRVL